MIKEEIIIGRYAVNLTNARVVQILGESISLICFKGKLINGPNRGAIIKDCMLDQFALVPISEIQTPDSATPSPDPFIDAAIIATMPALVYLFSNQNYTPEKAAQQAVNEALLLRKSFGLNQKK